MGVHSLFAWRSARAALICSSDTGCPTCVDAGAPPESMVCTWQMAQECLGRLSLSRGHLAPRLPHRAPK